MASDSHLSWLFYALMVIYLILLQLTYTVYILMYAHPKLNGSIHITMIVIICLQGSAFTIYINT